MRRLLPLLSLVLVTLWLPMTLHCALEAVGVIPTTCADEQSGIPTQSGASDGCEVIESGFYKVSSDLVKVAAPVLAACLCFLCLRFSVLAPIIEPARPSTGEAERPLDWLTCWHFVRRAAPPSRAPSLLRA